MIGAEPGLGPSTVSVEIRRDRTGQDLFRSAARRPSQRGPRPLRQIGHDRFDGSTLKVMYARRRHAYFAMMGFCIGMFVLAWTVVRIWSIPAAVVMCVVAMVIPPLAAIVANRRGPEDRWWDEPPEDREREERWDEPDSEERGKRRRP